MEKSAIKIITSWDDGNIHDFKIAEMLKKYGIKGIFFIPTISSLSEDEIRRLHKEGFDIGGHTTSHPEDMKTLSFEAQAQEIEMNKEWLETIIGKKISSFAYPSGRYNKNTLIAVEQAGFSWARTTELGKNKGERKDVFKTGTSAMVSHEDFKFGNKKWYDYSKELLMREDTDCFHLWGHAKDLDDYNLWGQLDNFLKFLSDYQNESLHTK